MRCFACGKMGYCASQCPNKKGKKKAVAASTEVEECTSRFDSEFALVVSLVTSAISKSV